MTNRQILDEIHGEIKAARADLVTLDLKLAKHLSTHEALSKIVMWGVPVLLTLAGLVGVFK